MWSKCDLQKKCDLQISSLCMIYNFMHKLFIHSTLERYLNWLQAWLGFFVCWLVCLFFSYYEKWSCQHCTFHLADMCKTLEQWLSICSAWRVASASPRNFAEMNFLGSTPLLLNQELWVGPRDLVYTSPLAFPMHGKVWNPLLPSLYLGVKMHIIWYTHSA